MNVEFHYYSTAFLAVKAGFSLEDATTLAYASQYVDHHHRTYEITTPRGTLLSRPTQNFSFWDQATVAEVLAPFHFFPAGLEETKSRPSLRTDGQFSAWDVRPNTPGVKLLLVEALKTKNLHRIGLALHTYSDTWAHQNFTARNEPWNRLDPGNRLPSPGHAQAGRSPDLWLATWTDVRLATSEVVNFSRFAEAARKIYRYLCLYRGKDFHRDEDQVAAELASLVEAGRGRQTAEDRMLEFILALNLNPYDRRAWPQEAIETVEEGSAAWPGLDKWKKVGEDLLHRVGLGSPHRARAKPKFDDTPFAAWIRAAEEHRSLAKTLIEGIVAPQK